jgi:hypothetical protein
VSRKPTFSGDAGSHKPHRQAVWRSSRFFLEPLPAGRLCTARNLLLHRWDRAMEGMRPSVASHNLRETSMPVPTY